jgi:hypothetical protein
VTNSKFSGPTFFGDRKSPLALFVPEGFSLEEDKIEFLTDASSNFQIGMMSRRKGYVIQEHFHLRIARSILGTSEAILVRKGICKVIFYDSDLNESPRYEISLTKGDLMVFFKGGHKLEMMENCELLEIKQGPFLGEKDKARVSES